MVKNYLLIKWTKVFDSQDQRFGFVFAVNISSIFSSMCNQHNEFDHDIGPFHKVSYIGLDRSQYSAVNQTY